MKPGFVFPWKTKSSGSHACKAVTVQAESWPQASNSLSYVSFLYMNDILSLIINLKNILRLKNKCIVWQSIYYVASKIPHDILISFYFARMLTFKPKSHSLGPLLPFGVPQDIFCRDFVKGGLTSFSL